MRYSFWRALDVTSILTSCKHLLTHNAADSRELQSPENLTRNTEGAVTPRVPPHKRQALLCTCLDRLQGGYAERGSS
jgi:hypothetical protein